jgi:zinc D-Ala-D-Ala carboxypeptidase
MERISKHISYKEGVFSNTATRLNIDNTPGQLEFSNMGVIADNIFEPLRKWVNAPIKITSFYRSPNLNKALGGVIDHNIAKEERWISMMSLAELLML